jgi:O-antigen ligase
VHDPHQLNDGAYDASSSVLPPAASEAAAPARGERFALRVMQVGAVAVVLIALTWKEFELDRFFVPKELVLHLCALLAGMALLRHVRRLTVTPVDVLLAAFLLLSAVSAVFATNGWYAMRALAISASSLTLFWCARVLRSAGLDRRLVNALALAVALGVITSLLQTYGVRTDLFSINRAPGGTLGNRNFVAHMAAFGLPLLLLVALRTASHLRYVAASVGATLLIGGLVLTRSRAGFLALAAVLATFAVALLLAPALRRSRRTWTRLIIMLAIAAGGVAAAMLVPNTLRWRGDNPYLESITGVANFQEGSGAGRLVQYRQSLKMTAAHPLFGVGPGNWPVRYPEYAAPRDPSLNGGQPGTTSNPWPSSDWIAFTAERGPLGMLALAIALFGLAFAGARRALGGSDADDAIAGAALVATILAAVVAGMFDAVLLLGLPAFLVWSAVGALWQPPALQRRLPSALLTVAFAGALFLALVGTLRSAAQVTAMGMYANVESAAWLQRAAFVDPGNYRLRVRLARPASGLRRAARCEHANAAHELQPAAREARNLSRGCD